MILDIPLIDLRTVATSANDYLGSSRLQAHTESFSNDDYRLVTRWLTTEKPVSSNRTHEAQQALRHRLSSQFTARQIPNITTPGHFLHPGMVIRQVMMGAGGYTIKTNGYGSGLFPRTNEWAAWNIWGPADIRIRDLINRDRFDDSVLPGN